MANDDQDLKKDQNKELIDEDNKPENNCVEIEKERDEYKNRYLRALADYQNLEKRLYDERDEIKKRSQSEVIIQLLPFLDNLEKAEIFIKDPGMQMVKKQFEQVLEEIGVTELDLLGQEFDPHFAEAIDVVEGKEDNRVVEVLQKGYLYKDKVIRVAHVKVSKKTDKGE